MKIYLSLIKKEFMESIRTKKLPIILVLFLFIGLIGPLTAKLTPLIFEIILPEGFSLKIPEPVEIDSWIQFFKNINQVGMIGIVLLFNTNIVNEFQKGTLINLLSKGLPRYYIILSKVSFNIFVWMISYTLCFFVSWIYTGYFFGNSYPIYRILQSVSFPFIFGLFLISIEVLGSIITENVVGTLIFVVLSVVIQFMFSIKAEMMKYFPIYLINRPVNIINGISINDYLLSMLITFIIIIIAVLSSIFIMNKKQIS